ncbi:DUF5011/hyalin repeat domain-containing protein [Haploplasma axanthum]|uniref:HYR domain-containing protein n=1 Tax=Haploplasma axanthum TaxID=29552 RepID=A0A449BBH4_HAPAX|nr:hypothetical protein [Haploplasma axanthum]VEU79787.1 Uncharacterised protein [Haploplasma axanthum]
MKKISIFILTILSILTLASCAKDPIIDDKGDKLPPVFSEAENGRLSTLEHLKGADVDFLKDIKVIDNVDSSADIVVTVSDFGTYDKNVVGESEITYTAKDKAGNTSTIKRTIIVLETLERTLSAIVIGDEFTEYAYNDETAFTLEGDYGAKFRTLEVAQVMEKDFFNEQLTVHADNYPTNAGIPLLPYGSLALVNNDGKVVHARFSAGALLEMDANGVVSYENLEWADVAGGNLLKGITERMNELLPNGGKVVFVTPVGNPRIFMNKNLFWSEYLGGGGMYKDVQDVDITQVKIEFHEEYKVVIKKPDSIVSPEISVNRHVLSWTAIENAKGYDLYIDGEKFNEELITATSVELLKLELELTPEGSEGYNIEVVAITKDEFKWSNSNKSNSLKYKMVDIKELAAPVIKVEAGVVSWEAVTGTEKYEIYITFGTYTKKVGETTDTSFTANILAVGLEGNNYFTVKGIGTNEYSDSAVSNKVLHKTESPKKVLEVSGIKTNVNIVTAENYFNRRNATDVTKFDGALYLITGVSKYKETNRTEATSTIVVLTADFKVKMVRNILAAATTGGATYTPEKGWFIDESYKNQAAQLADIDKYVGEDDYLLIGKFAGATAEINGETKTVSARELLAYTFIANWDIFPAAPTGTDGWRGSITTFHDVKEIEFTLEDL